MDDKLPRIIGITPCEIPDPHIVHSLYVSGALGVLDVGQNPSYAYKAIAQLEALGVKKFGIKTTKDHVIDASRLPDSVAFIITEETKDISMWHKRQKTVLAQVTSLEEALVAMERGAKGLIAKGNESGGWVGEKSSFILLQQLVKNTKAGVWVQGGIGIHTAASCIAAGATGVVLDSQLALLRESSLDDELKELIQKMDGSETKVVYGRRIYMPAAIKTSVTSSQQKELKNDLVKDHAGPRTFPIGQDGAFAKRFKESYECIANLVRALESGIAAHLVAAEKEYPLDKGSDFAVSHGISYPIAQGPMSRISDNPRFAASIAAAGGLPFLALSLTTGTELANLLSETQELLGEKPWGVGLLGFMPDKIFDAQIEIIKRVKPNAALIAGGTPRQARLLEELGITTYIHAPTPGLCRLFLKEGARKFILEGHECGGHIGPTTSFCLWEEALEQFLAFDHPEELSIVFAGGICDELSASMVAIMSATLALKGTKVGVLMGTAYLFTTEAIQTEAILPLYQKLALDCTATVVLESAPGHRTRCLENPFTTQFNQVKKRLLDEGASKKSIHLELENLNLGRLRIAAKGLERQDKNLIKLNEKQQFENGLYMVGQAAALLDQVVTIEALHQKICQKNSHLDRSLSLNFKPRTRRQKSPLAHEPCDIAIIGMACIYPEARDLDEYWANILRGKNAITQISEERWSTSYFYDPDGKGPAGEKSLSKWGGFIPETEIDPTVYGIPPKALLSIEPVQILSLKVAHDALIDAGYHKRSFDRRQTAVIFGAQTGTDLANIYNFNIWYQKIFGESHPEFSEIIPPLTEDSFPGILANVIAGRIANRLDLGGVNCTVDAACGSSLAALNLAVKELGTKSAKMVLCGGADLHNTLNDYLLFSSVHALSQKDRCSPFDSKADGTLLGEGVACIVLKRLEDATIDGDRIYAVIKGIGASSDGRGLGLTAPNKDGQVACLKRAYDMAKVELSEVGIVEAHGTGTTVGDKIELSALAQIFSAGKSRSKSCILGSVKSQIGHTKCAAGLAGLIKIAKSLYHGALPGTINIKRPNEALLEKGCPLTVNARAVPWPAATRIGGVSAFGFGGSNFHAVLAAHGTQTARGVPANHWPYELFLFHDKEWAGVQRKLTAIESFLHSSNLSKIRLRDVARRTATMKDRDDPVLVAILAKDLADLQQKLPKARGASHSLVEEDIYLADPTSLAQSSKVAFMFPGQGSQYPGMLSDLFIAFPFLHHHLNEATARFQDALLTTLFPPLAYDPDELKAQAAGLKDTKYAQTAMGICDLALNDILVGLGITPDAAIGHSYGELAALCASGVISRNDLIPITICRIESILGALKADDDGMMAAVFCSAEKLGVLLEQFLTTREPEISIANYNAPTQTVITGSKEAIHKAVDLLKKADIDARPISVSCAFHSPSLREATKVFAKKLRDFRFHHPNYSVVAADGTSEYSGDPTQIVTLLSDQISNPVRFIDQVQGLYGKGIRTFVEVGPGNVLSNLTAQILKEKAGCHIITTSPRGKDSLPSLLRALAELATCGVPFDASWLFTPRDAVNIDIKPQPNKSKAPDLTWILSGHAAWPKEGPQPKGCLKSIKKLNAPYNTIAQGGGDTEQTVHEYLKTMREVVLSQRDVMLRFLGETAIPQRVDEPLGVARSSVPTREPKPPLASIPKEDAKGESSDIKATLLEIVSNKTGYPEQMLDLNLDMEADLSIDSIKRIEILSELKDRLDPIVAEQDPDALMEELSGMKTLNAIIDWFEQHNQGKAPSTSGASKEEIIKALKDIISAKTGYPDTMLEPSLDIEADLSIDSIKRIEIIASLKERLNIAENEGNIAGLMTEVAEQRTIEAIATWFHNYLSGDLQGESGQEGPKAKGEEAVETNLERPINRYVMTFKGTQIPPLSLDIKGEHILITPAKLDVATHLSAELAHYGAHTDLVPLDNEESFRPKEGSRFLIYLGALGKKPTDQITIEFFDVVKQSIAAGIDNIIVATGYGGRFGHCHQDIPSVPTACGLAGIAKTVAHEFNNISIKIIDIDPKESPSSIASYLRLELLAATNDMEVGHFAGKRYVRIPMQQAVIANQEPYPLALDKDSVIFVTGGARGITANFIKELASRYRCHFEIIGRSPPPAQSHEEADIAAAKTQDKLREVFIKRGNATPATIEKLCREVLAAREISGTLKAIESFGGSCNYHSLDVREGEKLKELIDSIYAKRGKIDGFIHGAGILEDKFIKDKSLESFERVFDTKVKGALSIALSAHLDTQFVVFFSSVAGAFGNRGQVDYAAANDTLDRIAWWLNERIKGRVLAINWGPWGGAGMVSQELQRMYQKRQIGLIPLDEGIKSLLDELHHGAKSEVQIILISAELDSFSGATEPTPKGGSSDDDVA